MMGKLKIFEVVFNKDHSSVYQIGDFVTGYVRIVLSKPKRDVRGIVIRFKGYTKTFWKEKETSGVEDSERTRSVTFRSKEFYFKEKINILGKDESDRTLDTIEMHAGEHLFPFNFPIPSKPMPYPFEGYYGHVRYKVSAKIDRPIKGHHKTQQLFCVVGAAIDLNTVPDMIMPSTGEDEKEVCCMCCTTGPIKVSGYTDKGGYVPGETVWISGFIDNRSRREVIDVTAKLVQTVTCSAKREVIGRQHTRSTVRVIGKVKCDGVDAYSMVEFTRKPLVVPSCPPSGLSACDLIDVQYHIKLDADIGLTPFDTYIHLPIIIGTIPYAPNHTNGEVITQQPLRKGQPADRFQPTFEISSEGYKELPNKSYGYTFGKLLYAPRYPYYNFPPPEGGDCLSLDDIMYNNTV